jgi:predicted nucleic acid-binding protein
MATLIDASLLIDAERGNLALTELISGLEGEQAAIAAVTASELLHGVHRAKSSHIRTRREIFVESLLSALPIMPFDLLAARIHARVWAQLAARGTIIGPHDLLIGATALANGFDIATRDLRSFPKIPGLRVIRR